jgi:hypothetical protein
MNITDKTIGFPKEPISSVCRMGLRLTSVADKFYLTDYLVQ